MDSELCNALEAIANILYLIRNSLDSPAAVSRYVSLAEDRVRAMAVHAEQVTTQGTRASS